MPCLSVREPNDALRAWAVATGARAMTSMANAASRLRDNKQPLLEAPTGLAVGLARGRSRYTAHGGDSPLGPSWPLWFPRSRRAWPAGTRLVDVTTVGKSSGCLG